MNSTCLKMHSRHIRFREAFSINMFLWQIFYLNEKHAPVKIVNNLITCEHFQRYTLIKSICGLNTCARDIDLLPTKNNIKFKLYNFFVFPCLICSRYIFCHDLLIYFNISCFCMKVLIL